VNKHMDPELFNDSVTKHTIKDRYMYSW